MRATTTIAAVAVLFALSGCTDAPSPVVTPTASSTSPAPSASPSAPTTSPSATATPDPTSSANETVSFTYRCHIEDESGLRTEVPIVFESFKEVWEYKPAVVSCKATKHGTVYTQAQLDAVEIAEPVLSSGIDQLDYLYAACAITDNGYLHLTDLTPEQKTDVRAFLSLCPDRPGADYLKSLL